MNDRTARHREGADIPRDYRVNQRITVPEVLVVTDTGERVGVMQTADAIRLAQDRGLDLVEVAPGAQPPVCRVLDYGRYRYEQSKKERELRKGQHTQELGEVRLRPKIGQHDIDFKTRTVRKLIDGGDKVKVSVIFRGRESTHPELAINLLKKVLDKVEDIAGIDTAPQLEGRGMSMILAPLRRKSAAPSKQSIEAPADEEAEEAAAAAGSAD